MSQEDTSDEWGLDELTDTTETEHVLSSQPSDNVPWETPQPEEEMEEEPDKGVLTPSDNGLLFDHDETRAGATSAGLMEAGEYMFAPAMGSIAGRTVADVPLYVCQECGTEVEDVSIVEDVEDPICNFCGGEYEKYREPSLIDNKYLSWWEEDSIMPQYPYMLVNPVGYRALDGNRFHFADALRLNKGEQFVVCDSGGYQILSQSDRSEIVDSPEEHSFTRMNIYPPAIVEWQVRNADVGMILDVPPNVMKGARVPSNKGTAYETWVEDIFKPRLAETAEYAGMMADRLWELREQDVPGADDFKQLLVIHGRPAKDVDGWGQWNHLHEWTTTLEEAMGTVDGYAIKPQPSQSLGQMAFHLGYVAAECSDGLEYMHCLQCGGVTQQILLRWFARLTDTFVTSDASSHIMGTEWRKFRLPGTWNDDFISMTDRGGLRWLCHACGEKHITPSDTEEIRCSCEVLLEREADAEDIQTGEDDALGQVDRFPCRCLVCERVSRHRDISFATEDIGGVDGQYINMHNIQQILTSNQTASALLGAYSADTIINDATVTEVGFESLNRDNEFWETLRIMFSPNSLARLYTAMNVVYDAVEEGREGLSSWTYEWSSDGHNNEPSIPTQDKNAMNW